MGARSGLAYEGICDWKHLGARLKEHETSMQHNKAQSKYIELKKRHNKDQTIDVVQQRQINGEIEHWRGVLKRIILSIQYLAKHNDALRGSNCTIFTQNNRNFLGLIEMISKFDIRMAEHLRRIKNNETNDHYLGPRIQNQIIELFSKKVREEIISKIKESKYFSVQMDCTTDMSHIEQLTFIIRIVEVSVEVKISEFFIGFTPVIKSTGLNLFDELQKQLLTMKIN